MIGAVGTDMVSCGNQSYIVRSAHGLLPPICAENDCTQAVALY